MKDSSDKQDQDSKYDKIKHLVEVDDDILAVFSIVSSELNELYIAENAHIDKKYVDSLVHLLESKENTTTATITNNENLQKDTIGENNILGRIKWSVVEYEKIRILKIYEVNKTIFVLIKSNTKLEHTVDNILGYYYDLDEIPKSLF
ncbi:hypothetical protein [Candidatus Nitrosocosmicus franklandus]|uniref:Uncharacterized protein n=1 Tax=Candidatus Nitrosocosmicus franklandianus TaxID=1798806 RepID=A0A484IBY2_9ARCH|nr:hypothetical protein [Candidatus Nitrosocosmicus franklandus]VFJ14825.1 conserved protein of unknown function [Candidatus Nitrosocosmicus franklandus]